MSLTNLQKIMFNYKEEGAYQRKIVGIPLLTKLPQRYKLDNITLHLDSMPANQRFFIRIQYFLKKKNSQKFTIRVIDGGCM